MINLYRDEDIRKFAHTEIGLCKRCINKLTKEDLMIIINRKSKLEFAETKLNEQIKVSKSCQKIDH